MTKKNIILLFLSILFICILSYPSKSDDISSIPTMKENMSLEKAMAIALENNPMLNKMKEEYSYMGNMKKEAQSELYPKLYFSTSVGYNNMPNILSNSYNTITIPEKGGLNMGLNLMYPLYTGGKITSSIKSAEYKELVAYNEIALMENNVSYETKRAYFGVLLSLETVKVYEELINLQQEQVKRSEELYKQGKIAYVYLLKTQNELTKNKQMLNMAIFDKETKIAEFKESLGISQESEITFEEKMTAYEFDKTLQDCLPFVKKRPDVLGVQNIILSAKEDINVTKSEYLPQTYIMAMSDYMNKFMTGTSDYNYGVALTINFPVFDAGSRDFKTKSAENLLNQYTQEAQKKILNAQKEIVSAWWNYTTANQNIVLSEAAIKEAEEIYKIMNLKYEAGKAIYLELLDATVNLSLAKLNKYNAIYRNNTAYAELFKTIGLK